MTNVDLTPYILALLAILSTAGAWLFKQVIQHGKDLVSIRTALNYYLAEKGKGASVILEASTNPTPEEVKQWLREYRENKLSKEHRKQLETYLRTVTRASAEKFAAATDLLAIIGAEERLKGGRDH